MVPVDAVYLTIYEAAKVYPVSPMLVFGKFISSACVESVNEVSRCRFSRMFSFAIELSRSHTDIDKIC